MRYLIGFDDEQALDAKMVGQKFCRLARAFRAGFAVPQAVAISTQAHHYFLTNNSWPDGLTEEVYKAAYALEISRGLSIRSSATREDHEKQSFAGQYRSFLQIVDQKDLKHNIEACWQSVSSEAAQSYLQAKNQAGYQVKTPLMGVVIQKMVNAVAAGIAFGRNPMQPASNEIVVEAVDGLAEDLVSGRRTPYRAAVNADGEVKLTPPDSKTQSADGIDPMLYLYPFWREIAQLVRDLEIHNGKKPLDIEWAVDAEKKIWLLQSRPITTLDERIQEIPAGLWTRKIADDLWADRLTPFLAQHMVTKAPLFDMTRTLKILGIPVTRPTLTVIHGYLYINCLNVKTGIAYAPPGLRLPELKNLLPPSARTETLRPPSAWRLVAIGLRSILMFLLEPGANPYLCLWLTKSHRKKIHKQIDRIAGMPTTSPRETMDKIKSILGNLSRLQIYNQWPYFFATFTTWVVRWLAVDRMGFSHNDFLNLISKNASNITVDIERDARAIATEIAGNSELADRFLKEPADQLKTDLPPNIQIQLDRFLARYGCRSRHRTLLIKRWIETPQEVIHILQSLVRNQKRIAVKTRGGNPPQVSKMAPVLASSADTSVKGSNKPSALYRFALWLTTRLNRKFLDLREDLRFSLDQILYLLRQTLLDMGDHTNLADRVLFLKAEELECLATGDLSSTEARLKTRRRYDQFLKPFAVDSYYSNGRAENEFDSSGVILSGIGTSPGRVQGIAKIVDDPGLDDIESGQILIAKNADPGWTPILSIVKGMVMEEGGLLNHCSIVARELGVPSVVGVRNATQKIRDNDLVTIDGGLGLVRIDN